MSVYTTLGTDDENLKITITDDLTANLTVIALPVSTAGGGGAVDSVNGETGTVVIDTDDIAEGTTNEYHTTAKVQAVIDTNTAGFITDYTVTEGDVTAHQAALSITESQISDLGAYITDYTVTETDVTTHQAALSITESQISDLDKYTDTDADARIAAADLQDLNNVNDALNPSDTQVLAWDNTNGYWTNADASGGGLTQSTTPTITFDITSTMPEGYVTGQITNWTTAYTTPAVEIIVDTTNYGSQSVSIASLNANSYSFDNTNGKFAIRMNSGTGTQVIKIRVQDFGESPSTQVTQNITVSTPTVSSGSYRYYRLKTSSSYVLSGNNITLGTGSGTHMYIEEFNLFTSASQAGTQFPSTMTANTTGSEVASANHEFNATYAAWKAFDRNSSTGNWSLSSGDPMSSQFIKIDLNTAQTILSFSTEFNSAYRPGNILIEGSNDDVTYTEIVEIDGPPGHTTAAGGGLDIG